MGKTKIIPWVGSGLGLGLGSTTSENVGKVRVRTVTLIMKSGPPASCLSLSAR